MRTPAFALTILCLAGCATASPAPVETPPLAPIPAPPIPPACRPDLLTKLARPDFLPETMTVRDGLNQGAADRALALENAVKGDALQACVRALLDQRTTR